MRLLAFDTETYLISDTDSAPKPVCCTWFDGRQASITYPDDLATAMIFADPGNLYIGQNIAYDIVLMMRWHPRYTPDLIRALDEGRVFDIGMRERMIHLSTIGTKGYEMFPSLADMALKYLNLDLSKDKKGDDIWRLKYGTLDGVPFREWPSEALRYAMDDAVHTYHVFEAQGGLRVQLPTEAMQVQAAVVLQAIGVWGFAVNQDTRSRISTALTSKAAALHAEVDQYGWTGKGSQERLQTIVRQAWIHKQIQFLMTFASTTGVMIDGQMLTQSLGTDDVHAAFTKACSIGQPIPGVNTGATVDWKVWYKDALKNIEELPLTKKGPSTAGEVLEKLQDVVPALEKYVSLQHLEKMLKNYIEPYKYPTAHPRFVPLVTTGRTGCRGSGSSGQTQNIPRKDKTRPDEAFRTMFMARPGRLLGTVDYSQLELCTLAATIRWMWPNQACALAEAINSGKDVHCITGGIISGLSYEQMLEGKKNKDESVLNFRQGAKACIAKGSLVVTEAGCKPIETITKQDKVWDGHEWVSHDGVVCNGFRLVTVESRYLALTLDHHVYYSDTDSCEYADLSEDKRDKAYRMNTINLDDSHGSGFINGMGTVRIGEYIRTEVYDIMNAGPRHRFQCGGLILSNCNFGLPGGLGGGAFVAYARTQYGVDLSIKDAWKYINAWKRAWPEVPSLYLAHSAEMSDKSPDGSFTAKTVTGREKAGCYYTDGSNFPFQGLAADGAKAALWAIWREAMLGWYWRNHAGSGYGLQYRDTPLHESRLVNFVHDEIVAEHPEGDAGKAALQRQETIMIEEMNKVCRGTVKIAVESQLSNAWEH